MFQQLRYIGGSDSKQVSWKGTQPLFSVVFSPVGDKLIPDDLAQRLLTNPKYKGQFEVMGSFNEVQKSEPIKCDVCGLKVKSKAGLGSHKRRHKEKHNEEVT